MSKKRLTISKPITAPVAKEKKFFVELVVQGEIPADGFGHEVSSVEEAAEELRQLIAGCEWDLYRFASEFSFGEDADLSIQITEL